MSGLNGNGSLVEPVRVAVVGLGYWGPNLARNLQELPEAELVAVCDLDEQRRAKLSRRYPALRLESDFDTLLSDDTLEAVAIATPVGTHYSLALRALEAGKHIFVEKPLAASAGEAAHLVEVARERNLTIIPGHTFLYSPSVNLVREQIRLGAIGRPHFVSMSRVNLGLHQNDVSVVWDLGAHDFSILRYWLDENPVAVSAIGRSCVIPGRDDVAFINLEYGSGTIAHVELSWLAPSKLRRTTIVGSRQMVVYDDTSNEPVRIFDSGVSLPDFGSFGEHRLSYRTGDIISPRIEHDEPLVVEFADFVAAIREGRRPISHIDLGIDVIRVIEAVERSLSDFGARTPVDLAVRAEVA
jgi:predicted dehydrogenase